ncbi:MULTISPECIES: DUF4395 domain-containing protein [Microbacterium]|jgi:hypothetical protein|uniref:DUF4395 domain-containing protein n=1 Tax=Microbacterium TaxID=33882 RepID=UPI001D17286D|nr:DUF4395 domain-containing protein [Microbacterium testaceum]MCC4249065.1 DUF4395 domain-containing protein [Microbacterium testaceum]
MPEVQRIDVRGPRFAASLTAVLLLIATFLSLIGIATARADVGWFAYQPLSDQTFVPGSWAVSSAPIAARVADPGFLLVLVIAALFLWGVVSPRTAPWGVLYRRVVQPRLAPATEFEDPRPPRFAQGVGLFVTAVGLLLHLAGVPWALPIAAAAAFLAAFLNAAFGLCLGCQLYLLLQRAGLIGRRRPSAA